MPEEHNQPIQEQTYKVFVDDNFHYMDASERYAHGEFTSCESAVDACKRIVDEFLLAYNLESATPEYLWQQYSFFGEDPFILTTDPNCSFSAWNYARQRCRELGGTQEQSSDQR